MRAIRALTFTNGTKGTFYSAQLFRHRYRPVGYLLSSNRFQGIRKQQEPTESSMNSTFQLSNTMSGGEFSIESNAQSLPSSQQLKSLVRLDFHKLWISFWIVFSEIAIYLFLQKNKDFLFVFISYSPNSFK